MATALTSQPLSVSEWIKSCSDLMLHGEHFAAADILSTRQRILDFSAGRSSFAVTDSGKFFGYGEAHARVGRIALRFLSWNCATTCETATFRTPDHHIVIHIPLRGEFEASQGEEWIAVKPGDALVVSAAGVLRRRWEGQCDLLNLRIDREAANHAALGSSKGGLDNQPLTIINLNQSLALARFIETIIHDLGSEHPALADPGVASHAERLLSLLLLRSLKRTDFSITGAAPQVAPYYVRRAEQYVAENYMKPVAMADLEAASGVSVRTLYYGFKQYRGAAPMKYLKSIRLMRARRRLLEAQMNGGRVGEIAAAVGYRNKSQFARDYKGCFGESPTATLRGRGR